MFDEEADEDEEDMEVRTDPVTIGEAIDEVGVGHTQYMLLIICGLTFVSDAAEVTYLSFVTEQLKCEWNLTGEQETIIAQAVFVGMIVGSPVWGMLADKMGRRFAFLLCSAMICTFGFLTAICTNFVQFIIVQSVVGFGVAGLPVGFDILAEALSDAARGGFLLYIEYFWTIGSIYVNLCAYYTLEQLGWQFFTALTAIPTLLAAVAGFFFLSESPVWLAEEGRDEEALEIVNKWALDNGANVRFTELVHHDHNEAKGEHGPMDLLRKPRLRRNTILMTIGWFAFGLAYYGVVSLLPRLLRRQAVAQELLGNVTNETNLTNCTQVDGPFICFDDQLQEHKLPGSIDNVLQGPHGHQIPLANGSVTASKHEPHSHVEGIIGQAPSVAHLVTKAHDPDGSNKCDIQFDFVDIGISCLAEVLGVLVAIFLIDNPGRVTTQFIFFTLGAFFSLILGFPSLVGMRVLTLASSGARMAEMAGSCAMWVHTPELFPTHLRAEAHGLLNLVSKIGATLAQYLISDSVAQWVCGLVIAGVSMIAAIAVCFLPETAGKTLAGFDDEESSEESDTDDYSAVPSSDADEYSAVPSSAE